MIRLKQGKMEKTILVLFILLSSHHETFAEAKGDMADYSPEQTTLPTEYVERFLTDHRIDGSENPQKCAEEVLRFRARKVNETTLGVQPTVGLGAALLIFLLVGAFAAGIAQAFQMVSIYILRLLLKFNIHQHCIKDNNFTCEIVFALII